MHSLNQSYRPEQRSSEAVIDGACTTIHGDVAVLVPAGTNHNIWRSVRHASAQTRVVTMAVLAGGNLK